MLSQMWFRHIRACNGNNKSIVSQKQPDCKQSHLRFVKNSKQKWPYLQYILYAHILYLTVVRDLNFKWNVSGNFLIYPACAGSQTLEFIATVVCGSDESGNYGLALGHNSLFIWVITTSTEQTESFTTTASTFSKAFRQILALSIRYNSPHS